MRTVRAYDPETMEKARAIVPNITYSSDLYEAAEGTDAVIVTEWDEFRQVDWARLRAGVERPLIVDGRNILDATEVTGHGFHYVSVGRPPVTPGHLLSAANDIHFVAGVQRQATNVLAS